MVSKAMRTLVGPARFELATSCTPSKRASQAAPRPDLFHRTPPVHFSLKATILTTQKGGTCPSEKEPLPNSSAPSGWSLEVVGAPFSQPPSPLLESVSWGSRLHSV